MTGRQGSSNQRDARSKTETPGIRARRFLALEDARGDVFPSNAYRRRHVIRALFRS